jgi:hypothetical protein
MRELLAADDPVAQCLIRPALAIGFPESLGPAELFKLGGALNQDNELWDLIFKAWDLECASPAPLSDVRDIELAVLRTLPEHDRAYFRNRAIHRRNQERASQTL